MFAKTLEIFDGIFFDKLLCFHRQFYPNDYIAYFHMKGYSCSKRNKKTVHDVILYVNFIVTLFSITITKVSRLCHVQLIFKLVTDTLTDWQFSADISTRKFTNLGKHFDKEVHYH